MEKFKNRDWVGVERWRDSSDGLEDTAEKMGEEPTNQGRNAVAGGTEVEMQDNYGSSIVWRNLVREKCWGSICIGLLGQEMCLHLLEAQLEITVWLNSAVMWSSYIFF